MDKDDIDFDEWVNQEFSKIKSGLKKIADVPKPCLHPCHNPPSHIVLEPGVYEYTCPGCGKKITFEVPRIMW